LFEANGERQEDMLYEMQQPESAEDPGEAQEEGVLVVAQEAEAVVAGRGGSPLQEPGQQDVGSQGVEMEEPQVEEEQDSPAAKPHKLE
jgi:hypothetical protein